MVIMMPYVQRYSKTFLRYLEKAHVELKGYALFSVGNHWICPTMNCILAFSARAFYRESQHVDPALKSKKTDLRTDFLLILYGIELLLYWHCPHIMQTANCKARFM